MHQALPSACACTALRKATRALGRRYDAHLAPHGLSTAQFAILRHIARGEPVALSALAEALVMDRTTLYRALRPIEAAGWARTEAAPKGNIRVARLTEAGRAVIRAAEPAWEACQAEIAAGLGDAGWLRLHAVASEVVALGQETPA